MVAGAFRDAIAVRRLRLRFAQNRIEGGDAALAQRATSALAGGTIAAAARHWRNALTCDA